jgi:hypothetical protein
MSKSLATTESDAVRKRTLRLLMPMHNPPHPGEFIIEVYLKPNGFSGRELAVKLGVAASTVNRVLTAPVRYQSGNGVAPFQGAWPLSRTSRASFISIGAQGAPCNLLVEADF